MKLEDSDKKSVEIQKLVMESAISINKYYDSNSFYEDEDDCYKIHRNIAYPSKYPNNLLDLWVKDDEKGLKKPTIIYFHGGGFIFGSKTGGDPFSSGGKKLSAIFKKFLDSGYNVVSADYALAPEYRFPTQLIQVNEVFEYVQENSVKLGIDQNSLFLMGSSAGANLTVLYGAVISNSIYASKIKITPSISKDQIKGLIIDEAMLNTRCTDKNFVTLFQTFLGTENIVDSKISNLIDGIRWINEDYIPSFVISSNLESSFHDFALKILSKLSEKGIYNQSFYVEKNEESLEHGFLMRFETNTHAKICVEEVLKFTKTRIK